MINDKIGFIGIGNMGFHIADNIYKKYGELIIYDINENALKEFKSDKSNIHIVSSPKEVADKADVILISLPNPTVVESVTIGNLGIIKGSKVKTLIDLSTSGEPTTIKVNQHLNANNIKMLDSPVSGGVVGAI